MNAPITSELLRRCEERRLCSTVTMTCQALGEAVDAGMIELGDLLAMVKSCDNADQLGDALTMLAASAQLQPAGGAQ